MLVDVNRKETTVIDGLRRRFQVIDIDSGKPLQKVIACDDEAGWADVYEVDASGEMILTDDGQDLRTKRITGRFKIQRID